MTDVPKVRYARSGDIDIAYQRFGNGPIDLVHVPGFVSHRELIWEVPFHAANLRDLGSFARVLSFDKRGTGLSDRSLGFGSAADRMDDIRAVMDAGGVERASMFAASEGGPMAILFAATYPERVDKLVLAGTFARMLWAPDHEIGTAWEEFAPRLELMRDSWGTGNVMRFFVQNAPSEAQDLLARYERNACTPHLVVEIMQRNIEMDVRTALPALNVPTLVVHATGDPVVPVRHAHYLAENIANAVLVEHDDATHGDWKRRGLRPEVRAFLLGDSSAPDTNVDRVLATVLFTDIVGSTERTATLGDQRWRDLLDHHDRISLQQVERYDGRVIKTTGDGLLATFDGPGRAIACAQAIKHQARAISIDIRAGLHTGEIERRPRDITGLGVVIARRVCDLAAGGELLASRTVKDLVVGSGIGFTDRGIHTLKGVPDDWQLFAVQS
jgi:class 3 adenylate cyclase/alpha-beta hydrolase superfamily lysophospholipase